MATIEPMAALPLPPPPDTPQTFADQRAEFAEISSRTPVDEMFKADFVTNRMRMVAAHPQLNESRRANLLRELRAELPSGAAGPNLDDLPVPGGVGFGMFYAPAFRSAFQGGTGIYWEVVAPPLPGGNVASTLYLTATNRAGMGVEALVGYAGATNPIFYVFDWALKTAGSDPWQRKIPLGTLGNYAKPEVVKGTTFYVLPIMNMTYQNGPQSWINQVWFANGTTNRWDLVYQFSYPATLAQQLGVWPGSWGPIVETFQDQYQGTNEMGALKTTLSAQTNGGWANWLPLAPAQAQLSGDSKGFTADYLDPNTSWLVHS
jgi:hypothetical protein